MQSMQLILGKTAASAVPSGASPAPLTLGVAILAAGASSRMGQPKMALPWGGTSILGHILDQWSRLASHVAVVTAPGENAVAAELNRLLFPAANRIINPTPEKGMFSSIQSAAQWPQWKHELTHFALVLGDQPQISFQILQELREFAVRNPAVICQPSRSGRPKHPLILPRKAFEQLGPAAAGTLRDFLQTNHFPRLQLPLDDPSLDVDLDTPEDYASAKKRFFPGLTAAAIDTRGSAPPAGS
jgi:molybdenum cofactor cytidylyltransferase